MIGKTVLHYRIIEQLGAGGMGVVYKAEDTKLKRTVALKFLPQELTRGKDFKERFMMEAQAASALDHANICNIHGIEETPEGQLFICMAYYEGDGLDERIARGPLPLEETLIIAIQILEGLRKAHENGIVHRDMKPSNVMITGDGVTKILDFGVAKIAGQTGMTRTGITMGTVSYMSPEQARGQKVDQRTDLWAAGVIIYEMLTAQRPFGGDYPQATIYSILNENHEPVTARRTGVPIEMDMIISKCLEKNAEERYQSASDLRADLKRVLRNIQSGTVAVTTTLPGLHAARRKLRLSSVLPWLGWVLAAALIVAVAALTLLPRDQAGGEEQPAEAAEDMVFTKFTSEGGLAAFPSWSPDGSWIVYASDEAGSMDIWKKPLSEGQATRLTAGESDEVQPVWSPDGKKIAFASNENGGGIFLIPAEGGPPHRITTFGDMPRWAPDSETLAFNSGGDIYRVDYSGGDPELLVAGTSGDPYMAWNPDATKMVYWNRTKAGIFLLDLRTMEPTPLNLTVSGQECSGLAWSADGRFLVYCRGPFGGNKSIWKVELDPATGMPLVDPRPITYGITDDIHCTLSPDGSKLAFTVFDLERHLWSLPLDPETGLVGGAAEQLTRRGQRNYYPAASADGKFIVWTSHRSLSGSLYALDLDSGEEVKVTRDWNSESREIGSSFAPDSTQISYSSTSRGSYEIWRVPSIGSVALRLTQTQSPSSDNLTTWSPLGDSIAFYTNRRGSWDIWRVSANGGHEPEPVTDWPSNELYPMWSPDGANIAFRTDKDGNADIWVVDPQGRNPRRFVVGPGEEGWSAWSPDGRRFYYLSNRSGNFNVWMVRADESADSAYANSRRVTEYSSLSFGMPQAALYGKFAVAATRLIIPLESRKGDIYILDNFE